MVPSLMIWSVRVRYGRFSPPPFLSPLPSAPAPLSKEYVMYDFVTKCVFRHAFFVTDKDVDVPE